MDELSSDMISFLTTLDDEVDCGGICNNTIFYFSKSLEEGPPPQNCIDGLKQMFTEDTINVGIALLLSFIVTFFAFIV